MVYKSSVKDYAIMCCFSGLFYGFSMGLYWQDMFMGIIAGVLFGVLFTLCMSLFSKHIEKKMDKCGSLCVFPAGCSRHNRNHTRTDIGSHSKIYTLSEG